MRVKVVLQVTQLCWVPLPADLPTLFRDFNGHYIKLIKIFNRLNHKKQNDRIINMQAPILDNVRIAIGFFNIKYINNFGKISIGFKITSIQSGTCD